MNMHFGLALDLYTAQTETEIRRIFPNSPLPPVTSIPGLSQLTTHERPNAESDPHTPTETKLPLEEQLKPLLIVSDPAECNNNLCCYLKEAVDGLYGVGETEPDDNDGGSADVKEDNTKNYQRISLFSLRLITLNLFVKNKASVLVSF